MLDLSHPPWFDHSKSSTQANQNKWRSYCKDRRQSAEGDSDHFRTCHQQTTGISLVRDSLPDTKQMSFASRNNLINLTARSTVHYQLTAPSPSRTVLLSGSGQKMDNWRPSPSKMTTGMTHVTEHASLVLSSLQTANGPGLNQPQCPHSVNFNILLPSQAARILYVEHLKWRICRHISNHSYIHNFLLRVRVCFSSTFHSLQLAYLRQMYTHQTIQYVCLTAK